VRPPPLGDTLAAEAIWVGRLTREETDVACPRHGEVQSRTDEAAGTVRREGNYLTPTQYGTAVHKNLADQIRVLDDPNFRAEASFIKSRDAGYGEVGSKRIDVLENVGNGTVCVYDIKTGTRGLALQRSGEIAGAVHYYFPRTQSIIVIETRPRR
jgi:hypothetical protein